MVIERFVDDDMVPAYRTIAKRGRSLPDGLEIVGSWVEPSFARCFQLMRCDDLALMTEWVLAWRGHGVRFEIVPVLESATVANTVAPLLEREADRG